MITVRQIQADEWLLLKQVRLTALEDSPGAFATTLDQARKKSDDYWQERTRNGAGSVKEFCAIAINDQEPVGMAIGFPDEENSLRSYLISMWVAPSFRGSSIASDLIEHVIKWATDRGMRSILAGVMPSNSRALAFYYKIGFEQLGSEQLKDYKSDHPATSACEFVLEKKLEYK